MILKIFMIPNNGDFYILRDLAKNHFNLHLILFFSKKRLRQ